MTELQLFKFITANKIEWHHQDNDGTPDVLIFPRYYELDDLRKILYFGDDGIECRMLENYVAIWMRDICDASGFDLYNVFPEE